MAIIAPLTTKDVNKYLRVVWATLTDSDSGALAAVGQYPDKTVQITGVLDTAVPSLEGSMDNMTWFQLTFDGVNVIAALGIFYVWENPTFIRPLNVGGDALTDLDYQLGMSTLV